MAEAPAMMSTSQGPWKFDDQELRNGKGQSRRQRRRPDFPAPRQPAIAAHDPKWNEQRKERQLPPDHRGKQVDVEAGDLCERSDRDAERAERHGRGVGDERQAGSVRAAGSRVE